MLTGGNEALRAEEENGMDNAVAKAPPMAEERDDRLSDGFVLWLTGLSGAGKSTIAGLLETALRRRGRKVELLDGDEVRTHLSKGLGFSREDRDTNVKRIAYVAALLARNDVIAITAAISPYRDARDWARRQSSRFVEVFVECPLDVCVERDVKGLYARALAGEIPQFTGVSDPYEPPERPEIVVDTSAQTPEQSAQHILSQLERFGYIGG